MDIGPLLVADAQPAESMQPGDGALDDPAVSAQPVLGFDAPAGNPGADTPSAQISPAKGEVVALVGVQFGWSAARPSAPARDRRCCIQKRDEMLGIVVIGSRKSDGQRQAAPINQQMMLAAPLGPVGRIGTDAFAAEGGKARWKRRGCSGSNRFFQPGAGVSGSAGANAPRHPRPAIPATAASRPCRCRTPSPAAGLPIECRS